MGYERVNLHVTDTDHPTVSGRILRAISNWQNYRTPAGLIVQTDAGASVQTSAPDGWSGVYDFSLASLMAPCQAFFRNSLDGSNRIMWGIRRSETPGAWMNWRAVSPLNGSSDPVVNAGSHTVTWSDAWASTDLILHVNRHSVGMELLLKDANHPAMFRFTLRIPNGFSYAVESSVLVVRDADGQSMFVTKQSAGEDADGKLIAVVFSEGGTLTVGGVVYPIFRHIPSLADLSGCTYPVRIR
jgi:hypothetical protein